MWWRHWFGRMYDCSNRNILVISACPNNGASSIPLIIKTRHWSLINCTYHRYFMARFCEQKCWYMANHWWRTVRDSEAQLEFKWSCIVQYISRYIRHGIFKPLDLADCMEALVICRLRPHSSGIKERTSYRNDEYWDPKPNSSVYYWITSF